MMSGKALTLLFLIISLLLCGTNAIAEESVNSSVSDIVASLYHNYDETIRPQTGELLLLYFLKLIHSHIQINYNNIVFIF